MAEKLPINAVRVLTDDSGNILGVEDLQRGQSIPIENISSDSEFVCEEPTFSPYDTSEQPVGEQSGGLFSGIKKVGAAVGTFWDGVKELYAANQKRAQDEAVAQNMQKGATDCVVKKEPAAKKGDAARQGGTAETASVAAGRSDSVEPAKTSSVNNKAVDALVNAAEGGVLSKEAVRSETLKLSSGEVASVEVKASTNKEEEAARARSISPDKTVVENKATETVESERIEQVIKDKIERAEKILAEKMAVELADSRAVQEKADDNKAVSKEIKGNLFSRNDERTGPAAGVNSTPANDERTGDLKGSIGFGETLTPFTFLPVVSSDSPASVADVFGPKISFAARMEESFPAIIHNFIGCFYLQQLKEAKERGSSLAGNLQVVAGDRRERVQPPSEKEGGSNHSDHGGSSGQGQDKKREEESA